MDSAEKLVFNGINGETGEYLQEPMPAEEIIKIAQGSSSLWPVNELQQHYQRKTSVHFGLPESVALNDLAQTGWGVIFPQDIDPVVEEAVDELLQHRQAQAAGLFKRLEYLPGETRKDFLARNRVPSGPVDPKSLPYYLLLVGSPEQIPFTFQLDLHLEYAVGRIYFDTPEEYANYARSVFESETKGWVLERRAAFFGTAAPDDPATQISVNQLVKPLAERFGQDRSDWQINPYIGEAATKQQLGQLLGGSETPSVLFTATHGLGFPLDSPRQAVHQGAFVCAEWPGPRQWRDSIPQDFYFAGDDVAGDAELLGLFFAFHISSYSAGTSQREAGLPALGLRSAASRPFTARLSQRLLGHPKGGALAVVGLVSQEWGYSFSWQPAAEQLDTMESVLLRLCHGEPIGMAMEFLKDRYAELAVSVSDMLEEMQFGQPREPSEIAGLWTSSMDARNFVIHGDPASRLAVSAGGRPTITPVELRSDQLEEQIRLVQILATYFDSSELQDLAFGLKIDYDNLRGETLRDKARDLVLLAANEDRIQELNEAILNQRPMILQDSFQPAMAVDRGALLRLMGRQFSTDDIKSLCFHLGVNYENLPGNTKTDMVRELIAYFERRRDMKRLIDLLKEEQPHVEWSSVIIESAPEPVADVVDDVTTGWVYAIQVDIDNGATKAGGFGLRLRNAPEQDGGIIGLVPPGTDLEVTGQRQGDYLPVRVANAVLQTTFPTPPPSDFEFEAWPTEAYEILAPFGADSAYYNRLSLPGHDGVDIATSSGSKTFCVAPGQVSQVNTDPQHRYGIHVQVAHKDGFETIYGGLEKVVVDKGQEVDAGSLLGEVGMVDNVSGTKLHLGLKRQGARMGEWPDNIVDPTPYLEPLLEQTREAARRAEEAAQQVEETRHRREKIIERLRQDELGEQELTAALQEDPDSLEEVYKLAADRKAPESARYTAVKSLVNVEEAESAAEHLPSLVFWLMEDAGSADDSSFENQSSLVDILSRIGAGDPVQPALRVIEGSQRTVAETESAINALVIIGEHRSDVPEAVEALTLALADKRKTVNRAAAKALLSFEAERAGPVLLAALGDRPDLMQGLIEALSQDSLRVGIEEWLVNILQAEG